MYTKRPKTSAQGNDGPKATLAQKRLIRDLYSKAFTMPDVRKIINDRYIREKWHGKELSYARVRQIANSFKRENPNIRVMRWVAGKKFRDTVTLLERRKEVRSEMRCRHMSQAARRSGFLYRHTPMTPEGTKRRKEYKQSWKDERKEGYRD